LLQLRKPGFGPSVYPESTSKSGGHQGELMPVMPYRNSKSKKQASKELAPR
jgi:hypothetical protein